MSMINRISSENMLFEASLADRLSSLIVKMKECSRIVQGFPMGKPELLPQFQAALANELSRAQQFAWKLLKDVEAQAQIAASTQHPDAQP